MLRTLWLALILSALPAAVRSEPVHTNRTVFPDTLGQPFREALSSLNMAEGDPGFDKDYAEPRLVLPLCRAALGKPLLLTDMADAVLRISGDGLQSNVWARVCEWNEVPAPEDAPVLSPTDGLAQANWPAGMADMLGRFYAAAVRASTLLNSAFAGLSADEKQQLAAEYLTGLLNAEEDPAARADMIRAGIPSTCIERAILASRELDGRPSATHFLDLVERIGRANLLAAAAVMTEAASRLAQEAEASKAWPAGAVDVPTPLGVVRIGTTRADAHSAGALLVLDPGGDDTYAGAAGAANGMQGHPLAAIIDLGGDDRYGSEGLCGAGGALFGVAVLLDRKGNDRYECRYSGQGAGLFGAGWLRDDAGDDEYRCGVMGQAAAFVGAGLLDDREGNDTYQAGIYAQGFGGLAGVGWLCDRSGHDRYYVGGREPDYERHAHRFVAFGQGTGLGMRPDGGGGIGILADLEGNDVYIADVFGQGVGYWYSIGMLLDTAGHDSYQVYEYGQGTGIHLSSGLLYDGGGNDLYSGFSLSQGSAHDFAVGVLVDAAGDDTYTADHFSQGRAINNSFALLADGKGKDAYFARCNDACQGRGEWSPDRGFGSLAVLMDIAGDDQYSSGASNGLSTITPYDGVVLDTAEAEVTPVEPQAGVPEGVEVIEWDGKRIDPAEADFDGLMFHVSRYGCTAQRRKNKDIAWKEMSSRGAAALRYLVANGDKENIDFMLRARQLLDGLKAEDAAGVLLDFADDKSAEIRKLAVFLLGFCDTPQHAARVRPLLADTNACGAAARTLGKWKDAESAPAIAAFLSDPKERRRAQAATALGDIGNAASADPLIASLGDPACVVRQAARRALTQLPADAVGPRLASRLPSATGLQGREIIHCLGLIRFRGALRDLGRLAAGAEDPWLRGDAVLALRRIDPARAESTLKRLRKTEKHPFVKSCMDATLVEEKR